MSLTREAELARLIAEQESDDTYVVRSRYVSLDAPLTADTETERYEVFGRHDDELADLLGEDVSPVRVVSDRRYKLAEGDEFKIWYARYRRKWTQTQIAAHFGISPPRVSQILQSLRRRDTELSLRLEAKLPVLRQVYEGGARLIDIAAEVYEEVGYGSPESCYQSIRKLFIAKKVPIRPTSWKHGRSRPSSPEYRQYWKEQNARKTAQRRATLRRCPSITRDGKRCKRWAIQDSPFCMNHGGNRRPAKWPRHVICDALRVWTVLHGRLPQARDWTHATKDHPSFKTVYNVFPSWLAALEAANLTSRESLRTAA